MRISTAQIYKNGLSAMQARQADLSRTQQQLATGKRLLTPADDPSGSAHALKLHEQIASIERYARHAAQAAPRLAQEEGGLVSSGDSLHRVRELAVQAANATQTPESRQATARELRQIFAGLVDAANSRAANGEFLFAGFRSANQPFLLGPDGRVDYVGDDGQREIELARGRKVAVGDNGRAFMTIPRGNGVFVVTPSEANTGTTRVSAADIVDHSALTGEPYTIVMTGPDAYEIVDGDGDVVATGAYTAGQGIDIAGMRVVLDGEPAAGDLFHIEPGATTSIFAIVDGLAAALEAEASTAGARALQTHRVTSALLDIDRAIERVLELRTDVGARLNMIEAQVDVNADQKLDLRAALSRIEDLDYAEAISRHSLQLAALQAAQQTYVQVSRLSLFDWLK